LEAAGECRGALSSVSVALLKGNAGDDKRERGYAGRSTKW
jgi:hypothetical protein